MSFTWHMPRLLQEPPARIVEVLFHRYLVDGPLRPVGRLSHAALTSMELAACGALDGLRSDDTGDHTCVQSLTTALIKTFERPRALRRLLASLQRHYPGLRTIVVDDSRHPVQCNDVLVIPMPYNSGISAGRNEGLRHVTTKYVLIMDDDLVLHGDTHLSQAVSIMEQAPDIDIMGGVVTTLPFFTTLDYRDAGLFPTDRAPTLPPGSRVAGLPVYWKVANFFLGRPERLRLVGWEPRLKKLEHADFFTRATGVLTTVLNPRLHCLHAPTPFDRDYMQIRMDCEEEKMFLWQRYHGRSSNSTTGGAESR
jgi:glycosyl transferase family 2